MRFKPDNIIFDCREANILAILDKETGKMYGGSDRILTQPRSLRSWDGLSASIIST